MNRSTCNTTFNYLNIGMKKLFCTLLCCFTLLFLSFGQDKSYLYGLTQGERSGIIKYDITSRTLYKAFTLPDKPMQGYNNLIQASNGKLYGLTESGGKFNSGVLFSFDPVTSVYSTLKEFGDNNNDGKSPYGNLLEASDGKFYGMTASGGTNDYGVIFSFDPVAANYTILKNFGDINNDGRNPYGSLIAASDGKLYGMTANGGTNDYGIIFSFDPRNNNSYTKLKDFTGTDGKSPYCSLIQASNGKLYGMTQFGGTNGYGVIFAFDPFTNPTTPAFQKWDFNVPNADNIPDGDNVINGAWPNGSLVEAFDGVKYKLYGMTESGGKNFGVIFSFDPAADVPQIAKLMDFDKVNGRSPYGSLLLASDHKLYGMTHRGGLYDDGVIFSFDPDTHAEPNNRYAVLANFNGNNGALPNASLTEVILKSTIVDRTAPVLNQVTIASNNADATKAKVGDVISIRLKANEPIQELKVTIAGKTALVSPATSGSTTEFTATYTLKENDPQGPIGFNISFKDESGNSGAAVTATTDNSQVIFDKTAPALTSVSIASNNPDHTKAKAGDAVTINLTADEPIQGLQVTIAGKTATVAPIGNSPTAFTASYTMTGNDQEGPVGFSISFQDVTNNPGTAVTTTTNNSKVIFDQTAPAALISSSISDLTNVNPIPLVITFSETVLGLEFTDFTARNGVISNIKTQDNKAYTADFTPTADGELAITLPAGKVVDAAANNNSSSNTWTSSYDRTRPTVVLSTGAAQVTKTPFIVTFTISEPVNSFTSEDIALNNGIVSDFIAVNATEYTAVITPTNHGEVIIAIRENEIVDLATNGNIASAELKLIYDSIAPTGYAIAFNSEKIDYSNLTNASVRLTGAEIGSTYFYTITSAADGTLISGTGTAATANFDISALDMSSFANGTLTISLYQQDAAGNRGVEVIAQIEKQTRNIVAVTQPAKLTVPIRTTYAQLALPTNVAVTYSDNTKQNISVSWQAGAYNGAIAGNYELTGTLALAPGTVNQQNLKAQIIIAVEPNQVPTALSLSTTTFTPYILPTEAIGTFMTTDADDNQHIYALVNGQGDTDNSLFHIQNNALYLSSNNGLSGRTQFSIRVRTTDPYNNSREQTFSLTKETYATAIADLKIVNAFTPDNDGINDEWIIPELKFYNQVEIDVFDRAGVRLFHTTNPENGWNGKDLNGLALKGPFLYVVQVKDINLIKKGVVTILNK